LAAFDTGRGLRRPWMRAAPVEESEKGGAWRSRDAGSGRRRAPLRPVVNSLHSPG
jgi:hypothetical protein